MFDGEMNDAFPLMLRSSDGVSDGGYAMPSVGLALVPKT